MNRQTESYENIMARLERDLLACSLILESQKGKLKALKCHFDQTKSVTWSNFLQMHLVINAMEISCQVPCEGWHQYLVFDPFLILPFFYFY